MIEYTIKPTSQDRRCIDPTLLDLARGLFLGNTKLEFGNKQQLATLYLLRQFKISSYEQLERFMSSRAVTKLLGSPSYDHSC